MILKKLAGESEQNHIERVRRYLLATDDKKFLDIANLIDPENQFQVGFFELYNEVMQQRVSLDFKKSPVAKEDIGC